MPTGYTADLYEGKDVSFPDFALNCARAFGALVTLRDSPEAEIPDEFTPSDYNAVEAEKARQGLAEVEGWTPSRAEQEAEKDYQKALDAYEDVTMKRGFMRRRYEAMLEQVDAWEPPTPDHAGLKKFMQEQLRESIDFDTSTDFLEEPKRVARAMFKLQRIAKFKKDIEYHTQGHAEEVARCKERSEWVRQLRQSLGGLVAR